MNQYTQIQNFLDYFECKSIKLFFSTGPKDSIFTITRTTNSNPPKDNSILQFGNCYLNEVIKLVSWVYKKKEGDIFQGVLFYPNNTAKLEIAIVEQNGELTTAKLVFIEDLSEEFLDGVVWILKSTAKFKIEKDLEKGRMEYLHTKIESKLSELMNKSEQIL